MPKTLTEAAILRKRRAKGILVPLLEELYLYPVEPKDDLDLEFLHKLMAKRFAQDHTRRSFSPSQLGACVRQVYFAKTGVKRHHAPNVSMSGYFSDGNWRHLKWQFAIWKLHRAGMLVMHGYEEKVIHPAGDFDGNVDNIIEVESGHYIVDWKGMRSNDYISFVSNGPTLKHGIQTTGYAMIVNKEERWPFKIENSLLVAENKGGPVSGQSPLGIAEAVIPVVKYSKAVRKRLRNVREYEANKETPPPECHSTQITQFQSCPFSRFCLKEVREIQKAARSNAPEPVVAVPRKARSARARRNGRGK